MEAVGLVVGVTDFALPIMEILHIISTNNEGVGQTKLILEGNRYNQGEAQYQENNTPYHFI